MSFEAVASWVTDQIRLGLLYYFLQLIFSTFELSCTCLLHPLLLFLFLLLLSSAVLSSHISLLLIFILLLCIIHCSLTKCLFFF